MSEILSKDETDSLLGGLRGDEDSETAPVLPTPEEILEHPEGEQVIEDFLDKLRKVRPELLSDTKTSYDDGISEQLSYYLS